MIKEELAEYKSKIVDIESEIYRALIPKDVIDERSAILEVRAGAGGSEAQLFTEDLFNMYQKYAELKNWQFEILDLAKTGVGGYREASASITGEGVFGRLKFEAGVHRVQRVPQTEAQGRVHTSTATVAILPEPEEVDIKIHPKDLRIDVYRASGAGGQHVQKTESAVRITHIPTGVVVAIQDERSQHQNKLKAMKILRARLYEAERIKHAELRDADRKAQVGTGERNERIRTYNYQQSRITEHRCNQNFFGIEAMMSGGLLDNIIDDLTAWQNANLMKTLTKK